ncbi:Nucleoporin p58/p45 [Physocladia obscura]|uniref:Nucleoporin p58/p45 n=1 Tax=Physocladia obscura TaxID=109957 RepID=A0AAD5SVT1_9FUNG|nr:Nucleoporin p58/p45 [Physocladia obscura]
MFSFGQQQPQAAAAPATGGSLFGAPATTAGTNSLFGGQSMATAQPTLFGTQQQPQQAFGMSTNFGTTQQQQQQQLQQPVLEKTTRYGEIPVNIRTELDTFENFIQKQINLAEEIASCEVESRIKESSKEFKNIELKYQGLKTLLDRDNALIQNLRTHVGREMKTADFATRYFVNLTNSLESRLQMYRQTIDDLERHLQSLSQRTQSNQHSPQAIAEILKHQHESFLVIAGKIAAVHDSLSKQRDAFLAYRQRYFGDKKNPFKKEFVGQDDARVPLSIIAADLKPSNLKNSVAAGSVNTGGGFGTSVGTGFGGGGGFGNSGTGGFFGPSQSSAAPQQQPATSTAAPTGFGGFGISQPATGGGGLFGTPTSSKKKR